MRIVAVDLGDVRTGLAAGDDVVRIVQPLKVVEERDPARRLERVADEIDRHGADRIVVGLPLNMDGTEGERAGICRAFGASLHKQTGVVVHFQDERLSSDEANRRMARSGRTHNAKKRLRDALAACVVLEDYLAGPERSP